MRIQSFEFSYIKSFKTLKFDLTNTSVLIGQNDHGKSSILKSIDIVINKIDEETLKLGTLHPDLAEVLLPIFQFKAKARRVTINYINGNQKKQLHITVRSDLTFTVVEKIERNPKTTDAAVNILKRLREFNKFVLIPALRDASSPEFQGVFTRMLREHGLSKMIPQKAGGTPKEYRALKEIRERITNTIKPYINKELLPHISNKFGFSPQHELALIFDVDVADIGEWILQNLRLGFSLTNDGSTLPLSESGSGIQSGVLLALHRLEQQATSNPNVQYILAIEEPEAFLHPQKQKELYQDILQAKSANLRIIVTTHSPYIISETKFSQLGLVRKEGEHSSLYVPEISSKRDEEIFDAYSDEINAALFFAEKIIIVEGESDARVIKTLLRKHLGAKHHRISIISSSGNKNFSPYLKMIKAWSAAKIPHLVITDFDSITKTTDRAIFTGARAAGYTIAGEQGLYSLIDNALDKGEREFKNAARAASDSLTSSGINVFVFTSDLEFSIINNSNKNVAAEIMTEISTTGNDYRQGYDINALRRQLGSKGVPLNPMEKPPFKKPFVHKKIAETIDLNHAHDDIQKLIATIDRL